MGSKALEVVQKTKYLGVQIDYYLDWNEQIKAVSTKVSKAIGFLRACLYEAGWPASELARHQASPVLYERFESEPARLLVAICRHSFV